MPKREQVERLLKDDPRDPFLNYALAMAYESEGRSEDAIAQFRRLLAIDANHVAGYFQLGQSLAKTGAVEEARAVLTTGIDVAARVGDQHAQSEMSGFLDTL